MTVISSMATRQLRRNRTIIVWGLKSCTHLTRILLGTTAVAVMQRACPWLLSSPKSGLMLQTPLLID